VVEVRVGWGASPVFPATERRDGLMTHPAEQRPMDDTMPRPDAKGRIMVRQVRMRGESA